MVVPVNLNGCLNDSTDKCECTLRMHISRALLKSTCAAAHETFSIPIAALAAEPIPIADNCSK